MTDIVGRLRDADFGWSGDAVCVSAEVAEEGAIEIERLRARMESARAILEKDDGRGSHSEGWCLGGCLKAKLKAALFGDGQPSDL